MKQWTFSFLVIQLIASPLLADDPNSEARKRMSERMGTVNSGGSVNANVSRHQPVVTYVTYLTQEREWQDVTGRKMKGRLVAFSAPVPGKPGEVVVIKDGKVKLRPTGAKVSSDLPLERLSQPDQDVVKVIDNHHRVAKQSASDPSP